MSGSVQDLGEGWLFFERGWLNANHLASLGRQTVLVDSGYLGGLEETLGLLRQAGVEAGQVDRMLATHVHCDHVGGHAAIQRASGCRVELSAESRRVIEQKDLWAAWPAYYGQEYEFFPTHHTIEPGEMVFINGMPWRALAAPGHAAGQLSFFCPENGWLIAADAVWDGDFGVLNLCVEGHDAASRQLATLGALAKLPVELVIPGHGPLLPDGKAAIAKCLERVRAFLANPASVWRDQTRKITLYTLLMHQPISRGRFLQLLLATPWVSDAARRFYRQDPAVFLGQTLAELAERGLVRESEGLLSSPLPA